MSSRLLSVQDVLDLPEPPWLVDRILPAHAISMVWGPSNIGKSFVTCDLACSIAAGGFWLGHEIPHAESVVYVAAEGAFSFKSRMRGWMRERGVAQEDFEERLTFINGSVQLHEGVSSFMRQIKPVEPRLIIFDTLAACSLGNDEDSVGERGPVMESLLKLRKELHATILVVHHSGWGKEPEHERGSSALRGIMDTSLEVRGEPNWDDPNKAWKTKRSLVCSKQRDAMKFRDIDFRLEERLWMGDYGYVHSTRIVGLSGAR